MHDKHLYPLLVTFWDPNPTQRNLRPALGPSILAVGPAGTRPCSAVYSPGPTSEAECTSLVRPPPNAAESHASHGKRPVEMCGNVTAPKGKTPEQQSCKGCKGTRVPRVGLAGKWMFPNMIPMALSHKALSSWDHHRLQSACACAPRQARSWCPHRHLAYRESRGTCQIRELEQYYIYLHALVIINASVTMEMRTSFFYCLTVFYFFVFEQTALKRPWFQQIQRFLNRSLKSNGNLQALYFVNPHLISHPKEVIGARARRLRAWPAETSATREDWPAVMATGYRWNKSQHTHGISWDHKFLETLPLQDRDSGCKTWIWLVGRHRSLAKSIRLQQDSNVREQTSKCG